MAATKARSKPRASTRKGGAKKSTALIKLNPKRSGLAARSGASKSRRGRGRGRRRSNPIGGGVAGEAITLSLAGFAVTLGAPVVNRLVGGFLPLGQFQQPVIFAATGFGLAWLSGFTTFTRRFQRPLAVMGIALGATAILTPWVRRLFGGLSVNGNAGMSGYRRNMRGIGVVTGIPPNVLPPPPPPPVANGQMAGIAAWPRTY